MKKSSPINNERKLIKNIDNIITRYMNINDKLLETIANEDDTAFKEQAIISSSDNFLDGIMDNYDNFTERLMDRINQLESDRIDDLKQKKLSEFKTAEEKKKKSKIKAVGKPRPKKQVISKGKKTRFDNKEKSIIKRGVKAGLTPKQIRVKVNDYRRKENKPERSYSSINTQASRQRKQLKYEEK